MMILALQVHVLKQRKWSILKSFPPHERNTAWSLYVSLAQTMGYEGKKFVEEGVRDNGLMLANTVSFQVFDPDPDRRGSGPGQGRERGGDGRERRLHWRRPGERPRERKRGSVVDSLFNFLKTYGRKLRGSKENAFRKTKTAAFAPVGDPDQVRRFNRSVNARSDAYTARYKDESDLSVAELVRAESTEVLGTAFFDFVHDNLVTQALRDDPRFRIGICCFVVSALIRIEIELDLNSDRGKALLADALRIFLLDETAVETFIVRMAAFLSQPASAKFIKAGARCFEHFETGDLDALAEKFRETFEHESVELTALGESQETAIFVVRIADANVLRQEYGNVGVQAAMDHIAGGLAELGAEHGSRTLKSLGDSLVCVARQPGAMVEVGVGLLRWHGRGDGSENVPPHALCVGGCFGRAVLKDGDFFGVPMQLAASLAALARPGEACFPAELDRAVSAAGATEVRRSKVASDGAKASLTVLHVA